MRLIKSALGFACIAILLGIGAPSFGQITRLKELHLDTILSAEGAARAAIVAPSDGRYQKAIDLLQDAIRAAGGTALPVLAAEDTAPEEALREQSLIVLGNMNTSRCLYTLYRQWYTFLDTRYPGRNGWEVRSLHNPYGTGRNVLLLGGSDDQGVMAATREFVRELQPANPLKVGWLMKIRLGDDVPPRPEPNDVLHSWRDSDRLAGASPARGSLGGNFGLNPINAQAILYYMTGEKKYLDEFLRLAAPDPKDIPERLKTMKLETAFREKRSPTSGMTRPLRMIHHYWTHVTPLIWDLIEESPLLSDKTRLEITNDLAGNLDFMGSAGRIGTSRHGTYYALNAFTYGRYFNKYYPNAKWAKCLSDAAACFNWWTKHATYGERDTVVFMNTSVQPVVEYFMMTDPRPFLQGGVAQTLMKSLEILWSGQPLEESNQNQTIGFMFQASYLLNDGRYAFMAKRANYGFDVFRLGQSWWPDAALNTGAPTDFRDKIAVMPLAGPNQKGLPFDGQKGFNFLNHRTGYEPDDGFLFVDGFRDVGRLPYHVSAITRLRHTGRDLLNGYGNQFIVLRSGLSGIHVPHAAALESAVSLDGMAYVRTLVPDTFDSSWQRHILGIDDAITIVADAVGSPGTELEFAL